MIIKNDLTKDLLIRLKKISDVYKVADEQQRGRLILASKKTVDSLVEIGFDRVYVETLLIGGKEFLDSLYGGKKDEASVQDAQLIFSKELQ